MRRHASHPDASAVRELIMAGLFLAAAGCQVVRDPVEPPATPEGPVVRAPLPLFEPGARREEVWATLASWSAPHRFGDPSAAPLEFYEWSGPDGMRVEAGFDGGMVRGMTVSRTWGTGAPPVDGHALPDAMVGRPLAELEAAIGPGLLIERSWAMAPFGDGTVREHYKWAIHDRGIDTGLYLSVIVRGGAVAAVSHRWSRA
jgi:hypothetical protein